MNVRLNLNIGSDDAKKFGLEAASATEGKVVTVSDAIGKTLVARSWGVEVPATLAKATVTAATEPEPTPEPPVAAADAAQPAEAAAPPTPPQHQQQQNRGKGK